MKEYKILVFITQLRQLGFKILKIIKLFSRHIFFF